MLHDTFTYVSVVNAMLIHNHDNNTIDKGKTDKKEVLKKAKYEIHN